MIRKVEKEAYPRLIEIWESAVRSTHDFLKPADFAFYKSQMPLYLGGVDLRGFESDEGVLMGFLGCVDRRLDMLFIHEEARGKGIGRQLISYAIETLHIDEVDVNEENSQAVDFYKHVGFEVVARSDFDGEGRAYPILTMKLTAL